MSRIGEMLPDDQKYELIAQQLVPGTVLHLNYRFPRADESLNKFMVLVCWEPEPLLVAINSCIHPLVASDPDKLACQVDLAESEYDFLDLDSHVNCYEIEDNIQREEILRQVANDDSALKCRLTENDAEAIIGAVNRSKGIADRTKGRVIGALHMHYPERQT